MTFFKINAILFLSIIFLCGCTSKETFTVPLKQWKDACESGAIGNTPLSCTQWGFDPDSQQTIEGGSGLVFFTEPCEVDCNPLVVSGGVFNFDRLGADGKKYFRDHMNNIFYAFMERLINSTDEQKYKRIYFVSGDDNLKNVFMKTIKHAAAAHDRIDLFINVHGNMGIMGTNRTGTEILTGNELNDYLKTNVPSDKLRAVFSTACFSHMGGKVDGVQTMSITSAFKLASSKMVAYGHRGINWGPIHKDLVAFESWYGGKSFKESVSFGTGMLFTEFKKDSYGQFSTTTCYPDQGNQNDHCRKFGSIRVKGRGCTKILGITTCQSRAVNLDFNLELTKFNLSQSLPIFTRSENGNYDVKITDF